MNKNVLTDSVIRVVTEKVDYKVSYYKREVELQFRSSSLYLPSSMDLPLIKQFEQVLQQYNIRSVGESRMVFQKGRCANPEQHIQFIKRIQRYLSKYRVFIISQTLTNPKKLIHLAQRIAQISDQIGISKEIHSLANINLFIYCLESNQQRVWSLINEYIVLRRQKLIYSLNQFIGKKIHFKYYKEFVSRMYDLYKDQLFHICKSRYNNKNIDVKICKVTPDLIDKKQMSNEWSEQQRKVGIYGIQFEVEGTQSQFIRFYSLISAFFNNIHFSKVQPQKYKLSLKQIMAKLRQNKLKVFCAQETIVVFQRPPSLASIIDQLYQQQWKVSDKDFLNLKFSLINQHKKAFISILRSKGLTISNIIFEDNLLQFHSDYKIYEQIKKISRVFLLEMGQKSNQVSFIKSKEDAQTINQYYLQNGEVQLDWSRQMASLKSLAKDHQQNYNKLLQIGKCYNKQKMRVYSTVLIKHKLVKCQREIVKYSFFPSLYCRSKQNGFKLMIRQLKEIYEEQLVLVIVNLYEQNGQFKQLLKRNSGTDNLAAYDGKQILTKQQIKLHSIFILQITNKIYKAQSKLNTFLQQFISRKKPFRIVLPCLAQAIYINLLNIILKHLSYRKSAIQTKDIYLYIPSVNEKGFWFKLKQKLAQFGFIKINRYLLTHKQMIQASTLKLVNMNCLIQNKKIVCTSLNSFIFKHQIMSNEGKQFKLAIFIPKINCKEFIVNLKTLQVYQVHTYKVQKVNNCTILQQTINILTTYFLNQNYAVLYLSQKDGNDAVLSSLYVYDSEMEGILKKWKLVLDKQKVETETKTISFNLSIEQKQCYLYETHQNVYNQLMNLLSSR